MCLNNLETRAMKFAIEAHGDQMYGDHPYSYHLSQVVDNVLIRKFGDPLLSTYVAVAWLHDTMEDCGTTFKQIEDEFGLAIAYSVQKLTKCEDIGYEYYLKDIIGHAIAREVKICDTMANLTESFKSGNTKGLNKYPRQLDVLIQGGFK
jgi:(p)ppGpp synthase/HD superfamily hydrolase